MRLPYLKRDFLCSANILERLLESFVFTEDSDR